jgi:cobalt/nickel transport system ATP-binding protein
LCDTCCAAAVRAMTASAAAIELTGLSFSYPDGSKAIQDVSFTIAQGERVGLVGANGAGKSTLLLHLNGILESRGVTILGTPVTKAHLKQVRQKVGLVFQNPDDQLFCPTVYEDIAFGLRNLKIAADEIRLRVRDSLRTVGLEGFEERGAFHLSVGQKKRVALATVLAMGAEILVLDEPTSNLDPRGRREIMALLMAVGGTQIMATHDLELVRGLCSRVIVMRQGRIAADETPEAILRDAEFLRAHDLS